MATQHMIGWCQPRRKQNIWCEEQSTSLALVDTLVAMEWQPPVVGTASYFWPEPSRAVPTQTGPPSWQLHLCIACSWWIWTTLCIIMKGLCVSQICQETTVPSRCHPSSRTSHCITHPVHWMLCHPLSSLPLVLHILAIAPVSLLQQNWVKQILISTCQSLLCKIKLLQHICLVHHIPALAPAPAVSIVVVDSTGCQVQANAFQQSDTSMWCLNTKQPGVQRISMHSLSSYQESVCQSLDISQTASSRLPENFNAFSIFTLLGTILPVTAWISHGQLLPD
jgi:hypothetical protein